MAKSLEVLASEIKWLRRSIKKQDKETERRLDELNHAHANAEARQIHYTTTDKFEGAISKIEAWQSQVDRALSERTGQHGGRIAARESISQIVTKIILGVGVVVALAVAIWK